MAARKKNKKKKPQYRQASKAGGQSKPQVQTKASEEPTYLQSGKKAGLTLLSGLAGAFVGAAFGRTSFLLSLPMIFYGTHKNKVYWTAAGIGMAMSNPPQKVVTGTTNGLEGFGKLPDEANERVKYYFQNLKDKLFLPATKAPVVAGLGEDQISTTPYFINPYGGSMGELEFPELDRIQNQVSQMTGVLPGLEYETDREF